MFRVRLGSRVTAAIADLEFAQQARRPIEAEQARFDANPARQAASAGQPESRPACWVAPAGPDLAMVPT